MKQFVNKTVTINISEREDNGCRVTGHEPNRWSSQPTRRIARARKHDAAKLDEETKVRYT